MENENRLTEFFLVGILGIRYAEHRNIIFYLTFGGGPTNALTKKDSWKALTAIKTINAISKRQNPRFFRTR